MGLRIAYLCHEQSGNGFYRSVGPMLALELRGHTVTSLSGDSRTATLPRDLDVLQVHRDCDARVLTLARAARAAGAVVVWDNDDDIGSVPRDSDAYRHFGALRWQQREADMRRLFATVDLVTSTNETLSARLRESGAERTASVENYVPANWICERRQTDEGITIGWIAGLEHQLDVDRIPIRPVLERLLAERPGLRVHVFGVDLKLSSPRYVHDERVPLGYLTQRAAAFDIGIAPLADIALNRSRSNVKLKEYAAAGLPWLASPIGPYAGMGEKQGGRLVADDRWYEELSRLIDKERDRRKLAKRARKWVEGETLERNAHRWEELLVETVERARGARAAGPR